MPKIQTSFEERIARLEQEHASGRASTPKMMAGVENSTPETSGKKKGRKTHGGSLIRSFVKTFAIAILCLGGAAYTIENKETLMAAVGPYLIAGFDMVSESELASLSDEQRGQFEAFLNDISGTPGTDELRQTAAASIKAHATMVGGEGYAANVLQTLNACGDAECISQLVQAVEAKAQQARASN